MNNGTLNNKAAINLHCQICSRRLIFFSKKFPKVSGSAPFRLNILAQSSNISDVFYIIINIGSFKNNGKTSCVAIFVLES